ncbi:MAG TPA: hypothetical protein VNW46_14155 [Gemmatimonadaceae bacterium]|jgi:hypothetical protein|nr:hypothetical protein [Gemmatimonadaceae bacterium]
MNTLAAPAPVVPHYDLALLTVSEIRQGLARVAPADRAAAVWAGACAAAGIREDITTIDAETLERVAEHLLTLGGTLGVVGRAFQIRIRAYRRLLALHQRGKP